jgi:hypothetical protein
LDYQKGKNEEYQGSHRNSGVHEESTPVQDSMTEHHRACSTPTHSEAQPESGEEDQNKRGAQPDDGSGRRPDMTSLVQQAHQSVKLKNVKTRSKNYNASRRSSGRGGAEQDEGSLEGILKRSLSKRFASARESVGSDMSPSSLSDSDSNMGSPSPNEDENSRRLSGRKSFGCSRRRLNGVKSSCGAVVSLRPPNQQLQTVTESQSDFAVTESRSTAKTSAGTVDEQSKSEP